MAARLREMAGVEIRGRVEAGKLVVTLQTASEAEVVERLNAIQVIDGLLAAAVVFHHVGPFQEQG